MIISSSIVSEHSVKQNDPHLGLTGPPRYLWFSVWAMSNVTLGKPSYPDQIEYILPWVEATSNLFPWMKIYMIHNMQGGQVLVVGRQTLQGPVAETRVPLCKPFCKTHKRKNPSFLCVDIWTLFSPLHLNFHPCHHSPHHEGLTLSPGLYLPSSSFLVPSIFPIPSSSLPHPVFSFTPARVSHMALPTPPIPVQWWQILQSLFPYGHFLIITICMFLAPSQISTTGGTRTPLSAPPQFLNFFNWFCLFLIIYPQEMTVYRFSEPSLLPKKENQFSWNQLAYSSE